MKGRLFVTLFALPFFSVGVWMLWSISMTFLDTWEMRDWEPARATQPYENPTLFTTKRYAK
jgi:hypothetical protein